MEYGYKDIAKLFGISEITVRRRLKNLGLEGRLIDRLEGGTKRVFSEVDIERLKSVTGQSENNRAALDPLCTALAVLPEVKALLEQVVEDHRALREELTSAREEARQREAAAQQRAEALTAHLVALTEQAQRREESARRREAELTARLEAIQEELRRPWWKRLWPLGGN
jgi:DNA repair exonuclease SbcCD ATPase subunit